MALYKVDSDTAELTKVSGGTLYADAPVGTIFEYGGTTAPSGYGLCKHQAVSRTEYAELFSRIGTTYGSGDGSTTFNLPDKTQLKQDYTVKTLLDSWSSSLEDGSESHTFTASADGSYYFEVVLSNASSGKAGNNISLTSTDNKLISTWGYVGTGAVLFNKSVFLKAGTYVITHICQTSGIGGSSTLTVYNTRNEPVGSYIIKMKHTPVPADFMDTVEEAIDTSNIAKMLPYSFNATSNISAFNRKFVYQGNTLSWTATHTGRLTLRLLKHGDGYSLYLGNQNGMLDTYDNFFGSDSQGTGVSDASITLSAYVKKGDVIRLESNLPSTTPWTDMFFCQTGLLAYNNNYD